ncbi:MAG: phytase precursor [Longimicrobiales bacterium]
MTRNAVPSLVLAVAAGCGGPNATLPGVAVVQETFVSRRQLLGNLDSPAIWHGPAGEAWVLVTSKWRHRLEVYDGATGEHLQTVGRGGAGAGEFRRPNGVAVVGDLALVVERDNARVQVLRLPDLEPIGSFGETLRRPYGIAVLERGPDSVEVFVTDDYEAAGGGPPADHELGERVKHYLVTTRGGQVSALYRGAFGDTAGAGRLGKVESLAVDADAGLLLVADEIARDVKVYDVSGTFTGQVLWQGVIENDPEGIALYACGQDEGYWIVADQHRTTNRFRVFDRRSLAPLGAFMGRTVRQTDGIALTQRPVGAMRSGSLYAMDRDRALAAFDWGDVAAALGLRSDCRP